MKLTIKHPCGRGMTTLTARRSDTVEALVDRFQKTSGVAGNLQLRKGRVKLRLTEMLVDIGIVSGNTLAVDLRPSPRKRALRRREQGITKRSTAHEGVRGRPLASEGSRKKPASRNKRAPLESSPANGGASSRACVPDVEGSAASVASSVLESCQASRRRFGELARPAPAPVPAPAACVPKAEDIVPGYLLKYLE